MLLFIHYMTIFLVGPPSASFALISLLKFQVLFELFPTRFPSVFLFWPYQPPVATKASLWPASFCSYTSLPNICFNSPTSRPFRSLSISSCPSALSPWRLSKNFKALFSPLLSFNFFIATLFFSKNNLSMSSSVRPARFCAVPEVMICSPTWPCVEGFWV